MPETKQGDGLGLSMDEVMERVRDCRPISKARLGSLGTLLSRFLAQPRPVRENCAGPAGRCFAVFAEGTVHSRAYVLCHVSQGLDQILPGVTGLSDGSQLTEGWNDDQSVVFSGWAAELDLPALFDFMGGLADPGPGRDEVDGFLQDTETDLRGSDRACQVAALERLQLWGVLIRLWRHETNISLMCRSVLDAAGLSEPSGEDKAGSR